MSNSKTIGPIHPAVVYNALQTGARGLFWYALCAALIVFIGSIGSDAAQAQAAQLKQFLKSLPRALLEVFDLGDGALDTPVGYICARALSLLWPILVIAFTAGNAGGVSAMIEQRSIHFELSLPLSRTRWLTSRALAGIIGTLMITLITLLALYLLVAAPWWRFAVSAFAFTVMWLGIAYAISAFSRERGLVMGVSFALFASQFLLATLARVEPDRFGVLERLNVWSAFQAKEIVTTGIPWLAVLIWLVIGAAAFGLACWQWRRRDFPA